MEDNVNTITVYLTVLLHEPSSVLEISYDPSAYQAQPQPQHVHLLLGHLLASIYFTLL